MLEQNPLKNFTKLDKMGAFLIDKSAIKQLYINVSKSFIKIWLSTYWNSAFNYRKQSLSTSLKASINDNVATIKRHLIKFKHVLYEPNKAQQFLATI